MHVTSTREKLAAGLEGLGLGAWKYYPSVGSTNDLALDWAHAGAPDWALVIADVQTAGRGRGDRTWETKPGGLAISLVLRPTTQEIEHLTRFTALAGLGLLQALAGLRLQAQVKWPNDVLLGGKKVAGVLVETDWEENTPRALVVGMGINITPASEPDPVNLRYPATSVAGALGQPTDSWVLLAGVLRAMQDLRHLLPTDSFIQKWNQHLAFRGEMIRFCLPSGEVIAGQLQGVNPQGSIIVKTSDGGLRDFIAGEILLG